MSYQILTGEQTHFMNAGDPYQTVIFTYLHTDVYYTPPGHWM